MTDVLEERVARAIFSASQLTFGGSASWDVCEGPTHATGDVKDKWRLLARAAIAEVLAWQPVETAPKDGTHVLLYRGGLPHSLPVRGYFDGGHWCVGSDVRLGQDVPTHWLPLPPTPEDE